MESLELNMNSLYASQIEQMMSESGLSNEYGAHVKNCTNINQVFSVLSDREAKHVALLSTSPEPIEDTLEYIKTQLAENKSVSLAVFYEL